MINEPEMEKGAQNNIYTSQPAHTCVVHSLFTTIIYTLSSRTYLLFDYMVGISQSHNIYPFHPSLLITAPQHHHHFRHHHTHQYTHPSSTTIISLLQALRTSIKSCHQQVPSSQPPYPPTPPYPPSTSKIKAKRTV